MIELKSEPFDSGLWQKRVVRLRLPDPLPSSEQLLAALDKERPDVVYAFAPFSNPTLELLETAGFHLMTVRNTYGLKRDVPGAEPQLPDGYRLASLAEGIKSTDEYLRDMAVIIGGTSRYFHDRRIKSEEATELYMAWLRNSLYHGYAQGAFAIFKDERMVGLITLKIKDGQGYVDLLGVLPSEQGSGLGSILHDRAVRYLQSAGVKDILVVTEGENLRANAFYQRKGFILQNVELVYHLHPSYE